MNRIICIILALSLIFITSCSSKANHKQIDAIKEIEKIGGKVTIDKNNPEKSIICINLQGTNLTDEKMEYLHEFTKLKELNINDTKVTNYGLKHIKGINSLQVLSLFGTN